MKKNDIEQKYLDLAEKWTNGTISAEEMREYADWLQHFDHAVLEIPGSIASSKEAHKQKILKQLRLRIQQQDKRSFFMRPRFIKIAAAACIGFTALFLSQQYWLPENDVNKISEKVITATDIQPGINGAVLTLANGKIIVLDTAANGNLDKTVMKSPQVLVFENPGMNPGNEIQYNTLVTPRAHQQQLLLPDGSRVWLNAESSIRFPSAFPASARNIEITGEAYFEIAPDKNRPFTVGVAGASIEVLGTHFNVMAYQNEAALETTLLEGSVNFRDGAGASRQLRPGQQSRLLKTQQVQVVNNTDIELIMAWKNGFQSFKAADISSMLRQIQRWYNVDVELLSEIPDTITFTGDIPREVTLSQLLNALQSKQLEFTLDAPNRKIQVRYNHL